MRRLIIINKRILATLLIGALLLVCSLGLLSAYKSNISQQKVSCSSTCHSHGQVTAINSQENKDEEDDKEPTPPILAWLRVPFDLYLLYILPIFGVLWFISNKHKLFLTTQLRF